jgi:hypothetical protein
VGIGKTNTSAIQHHTRDLSAELAEQREGQTGQIEQWQQALFDAGLLPAGSPSPTSRIQKAGGQLSTKQQGRPPTQKKRATPQGDGKRKRSAQTPASETNNKQKSETPRQRSTGTKTAAQTTTTRKGERKRASGNRTGQQTPSEATPLVMSMQTAGRPTPTLVHPLPPGQKFVSAQPAGWQGTFGQGCNRGVPVCWFSQDNSKRPCSPL